MFSEIGPLSVFFIRDLAIKNGRYYREEFTGILIIPSEHNSVKRFTKKIRKKMTKNLDIRMKVLTYVKIMDEEDDSKFISISKASDMKIKFTPLKELCALSNKKARDKKFRIKICSLEFGPTDSSKWIVTTPDKTYFFMLKPYRNHFKYYFRFQIFCKDLTELKDSNIYTVFLCFSDGA